VKQRMRRTPFGFQDVEQQHLDRMIKAGVIRSSTSEWASAPVLVRKRDGSVRWCIDYRALNDRTVKDCFPQKRKLNSDNRWRNWIFCSGSSDEIERLYNKGNNKITEIRTIFQRESQNS
jgi:hypothetical protein